MRLPFFLVLPLIVSAFFLSKLQAQDAPGAKNLINNGGFERSIRGTNPWEGISEAGLLQGATEEASVLQQSGSIQPTKMPLAISVADLNNDGLQDIAAMDGNGYLRAYFNAGSKTESKFGKPEFASLFLNTKPKIMPPYSPAKRLLRAEADKRAVQRIHLADINKSGKLDLLVGTYGGKLFFIPNSGSAMKPDFRVPARMEDALISTGKDEWGNVFTPFAVDWNKDGRMDILIGEASYSANSIHILAGKKSGKPAFEDGDRSVLAYGMGLEELAPCVVDYNGDGMNDLLVAERGGKVAVYLNTGKPWKAGETLPFDSFLTVDGAPPVWPTEAKKPAAPAAAPSSAGGDANAPAAAPAEVADTKKDPLDAIKATNLLNLGGPATLGAGDFNGDGLFDLVVGKRSGRIGLALNKGTPTQPKFSAPVDIKSPTPGVPCLLPSSWETDAGLERGNFNGYFSVLKNVPGQAPAVGAGAVTPKEGQAYLKAGYSLPATSFMPRPTYLRPTTPPVTGPAKENNQMSDVLFTPNVFLMSQVLATPLKVGKTYILSFQARGTQLSEGLVGLHYSGRKELGEVKLVKGDRGTVNKQFNQAYEIRQDNIPFSAGANWIEVKKEIPITFKNKELNTLETVDAELQISFMLAPGTGEVEFDDFKLVEKP
jgi:hypothetical protein